MTRSPLYEQHKALGGHFQTIAGWDMPEHFGQPIDEHAAIRNRVGIADLSNRGINRITGEDRITWLQSLISNDIRPLSAGDGLYSALMDHKGKILACFRVLMLDDAIVLEDVGEIGDATYQRLKKFLLFGTKAKLENCLESWGILLISGPSAPDLVKQAFSVDMEASKPLSFQTAEIGGHTGLFVKAEETGEHDIELILPNEGLSPAWEHIWKTGTPFGLRAVGHRALESLRLEAGIPKVGPDLNERIVPPEANLEGKAFSLTKGCYPGQEVVARMDTYGSVKRRLVGLMIDATDNHLPDHGAKLYSGEREVGWVSSSAFSPTFGKPLAFGFPLRDFTKPDTALTVQVGERRCQAVVHTLPFVRPG